MSKSVGTLEEMRLGINLNKYPFIGVYWRFLLCAEIRRVCFEPERRFFANIYAVAVLTHRTTSFGEPSQD